MLLPFSGGFEQGVYLNLGICFVPFLFLTMLGTVNGANFTDGLDGLVSGVTLMIALFLSVTAAERAKGISVAACAVSGALIGFLVYNIYPARVFMGDTGSLALGGFVAASAFLLQIPLFIVMIGIVYFAEVLSVILQFLCSGSAMGNGYLKWHRSTIILNSAAGRKQKLPPCLLRLQHWAACSRF